MALPDDEFEFFFDKPWSDGLPVVIPTGERIAEMLTGTERDHGEVIGEVPPANETATVHSAAVHAVMAGCKAAHFPGVLASLEAVLEEPFNINGIQATMQSCAPLTIFNGPYGKEIGLHGGSGCFGPGFRANATIGRAIRLILMNLGAGIPGVTSMSTFSQPSRYTYCIRENEEESPWEPLSVTRGFRAEENVVTAVAVENPKTIFDDTSNRPETLLAGIVDGMAHLGGMNALRRSDMVVGISPDHAQICIDAGWSKGNVHNWLCEKAGKTLGELKTGGGYHEDRIQDLPIEVDLNDDSFFVPTMKVPGDLIVIVAGGIPGPISVIMSGWNGASRPVTRAFMP
ncbi:MAG TPA: hypothetical protein DDZ83_07495 [Nitrospinae bacterium]|nr:hypothetical protein [Nitrospinota bacterium]